MLCPTCGADYVEGITRCSDCGTLLEEELSTQRPTFKDKGEPLKMVHVTGPREAPMIAELLENNGIETVLQGERSASTIPAMGDFDEVRVWVRESDRARADEIIGAFFESSDEDAGGDALADENDDDA